MFSLRSALGFTRLSQFTRSIRRLPHRRLTSEADVLTPEQQYREQQKRNEEAGVLTELVRDFLDPSSFYKAIQGVDIDFFTGVPDSLLKDFCAYVADNAPPSKHVITCNEGAAIALASGYHLATGKASLVYMQNSGLGNAVNPLVSLCAPEVYSIPMLLLIGWRGEPGKRDEPQHLVQGQITPGLLAALGIPFQPLPDYIEGAEQALYTAKKHLERTKAPYALLVKRQTFTPYKMKNTSSPAAATMTREQATEVIISCLNEKDVVIGTTGMLSRELFELRDKRKEGHEKDFLTVGCMGHASSIALGIATQRKERRIICIDGDGAVLMHMGNLATVAQSAPKNFLHIVLNNGAHDSVGGQPTAAAAASKCSLTGVADAVGYVRTFQARTPQQVAVFMEEAKACNDGPVMLEVGIKCGSRKDLGRPTRTPIQNKADFMHFLAINS